MGSSPRAYLAYGIDLGTIEDWKAEPKGEYGGAPDEWTEDEDSGIGDMLDEAILKASGFTDPEPPYYPEDYVRPEPGQPGYWDTPGATPEWKAWLARKNEALEALGVAYDTSGYGGGGGESTGYLLVIGSTLKSVEWTEVLQLDMVELARSMELDGASRGWNLALAAVLTAAGLVPDDQPNWLMFTYYG